MRSPREKGASTLPASNSVEDEVIQLTPARRTPKKGGTNRGRDLENSSLALKPGQQILEFLEMITRQPVDPSLGLLELLEMLRQWTPKEEHMRLLCGVGLANLYSNTLRGNCRTGQYLVDRFLGEPSRPFVEKVAEMNLDEAQDEFLSQCREAGIDPKIAEQLLAGAAE
jgi:hypothetical protein